MDSNVSQKQSRRACGAVYQAVIACAVALAVLPAAAENNPERGGISTLSLQDIAKLSGKSKDKEKDKIKGVAAPSAKGTTTTATAAATAASTPVTIDPRRSLIVTDNAIINAFPILRVLNTLAAGSPTPMIARTLYDQWMDLHNAAPGINAGGHCNDQITNGVATLNGFQYDCPRAEGRLVGTNPTNGSPNSFVAIALVNRFDLATDPRAGGTDCGEYRIIYAKISGMTVTTDRLQLIFEGVLPNPAPNGKDLSGCLPVAQFWADLSKEPDINVRIQKLQTFYFTGLPGFEPVVKASHYGFATPNASGQIRSNLFMQFNWTMREYHLGLVNNTLKMIASANHQAPAGTLFNETDVSPAALDFRNTFLDVVPSLAINDINNFNLNGLPSRFNAGDSDEQHATKSNYPAQFAQSPNFFAAIQQKLIASGSNLSPNDVIERSMAMSCAGCHQLSNGKNLGGGLVWPASLGFVHVSEALKETTPEGQTRFKISPALVNVFLPHRQAVLQAFVNGV